MRRMSQWLVVTATAMAPAWSSAADFVTKIDDLGLLTAPITLNFGHAFNDADTALAGIQLGVGSSVVTLMPGDQFADDYRFSVGAASATAITGTIDLGTALDINALEVRLFVGDALPAATPGSASPFTLLVPQAVASGTGELRVFDGVSLPAGNYVMEIRGLVAGTTGGSYATVMNLSPVPEPGAVLLGAVGLGVIGLARRRTR